MDLSFRDDRYELIMRRYGTPTRTALSRYPRRVHIRVRRGIALQNDLACAHDPGAYAYPAVNFVPWLRVPSGPDEREEDQLCAAAQSATRIARARNPIIPL